MEGGHIMEPTSSDAVGRTLVAGRRRLDAQEAEWFAALAEFDYRGGWAMDGHLSCVSWLVHFCGMARATAKEKLRVALELARRPVLAAAHAAGEVSYSKVRALTRIENASAETDQALLVAAQLASAVQLDQLARHYQELADQERPADTMARYERRGVRRAGTWNGMTTTEIVLPVEDAERLYNILDSHIERQRLNATRAGEKDSAESSPACDGEADRAEPVDEAPAGATLAPCDRGADGEVVDKAPAGAALAACEG